MRIQLSDHFNYKKLLIFVLPSIIMMVFTNVYTAVDGLFVSNFVGKEALAAINRIFPMIFILGSVGMMLGAGGSALVSKTLGEGDKERANSYFSMIVYVTMILGVTVAAAGQSAVPWVAKLVGAEGITYEYCVLYGRFLLAGHPFFLLQALSQSFFVTAEKPRLGLMVTVSAGVINMALDAVFVAGFKWGLTGAAAATLVSQIFGGLFPVIYFLCRNNSLLRLKATKFYGKPLLKAFTNGSSELLSNASAAVVTFLYNWQLDKISGDAGIAAYAAISYIAMIFFSVFMGYSIGSAPLIGYNFGAENKAELKNLFKKSLIVISVCGVLMTALSEALAVPLARIFVSYDEELLAMTVRGFRIFSVAFLVTGYGVFGSALFTALNNGLVSAILSFMRTIAFYIIAILIFPLFWGLDGVWVSTVFAEIAAMIVSAVFVIAYRKKYGYF